MAVLDGFDRVVEALESTTNEVREMLRTLMTGKVGTPTKPGTPPPAADLLPSFATVQKTLGDWYAKYQEDSNKRERTAQATETISGILSRMEPGFAKQVEDAKNYADAAAAVKNTPTVPKPLLAAGGAGPTPIEAPKATATEDTLDKAQEGLSKDVNRIWKLMSTVEKNTKHLEAVKDEIIKVRENLDPIKEHATEPGSLFVTDIELQAILKDVLKRLKKTQVKVNAAGKGGGGGGGGTPTPKGKGKASAKPTVDTSSLSVDELQAMHEAGMDVGDALAAAQNSAAGLNKETRKYKGLLGMNWWVVNQMQKGIFMLESSIMAFSEKGESVMNNLFGGVIKDELTFMKNIRATAYETTGLTNETEGLQKQWQELGKTVQATGVDRTKFQTQYIKAVRSGIRDLKQAQQLTVTTLNTERQLGLEAGALQETFMNWAQGGRMTNMQLAEMGRSMRDVARNTGLTGDALKSAIDSSKELVENLSKAAQLTAASAKNVMEVVANAQKLNVGAQASALLKSMTSTTDLLMNASKETSGFLLIAASRAGRVKELMEGTITRSRDGMKDMVKGFEGILKSFGLESMEAIDQLPDEVKFRLNLNLKSAFGMELGEIRNVIQSFKDSSKGLADRLDTINKKRKQNLTLEEQAALKEQERALKATASLSMLTALDEAAKGASSMQQALAKFGDRRKEFEGDLKAMGHAWGTNADAAKKAIEESIQSINTGLAKAGKAELKISTEQIEEALKDPTKFRELGAQLSRGDQELATAQKAQLDPISNLNQGMMELNETIREYSSKALNYLLSLTGTTGLIATLMATNLAKLVLLNELFSIGNFNLLSPSQWPLVGRLFSKEIAKQDKGAKGVKTPSPTAAPSAPTTPQPSVTGPAQPTVPKATGPIPAPTTTVPKPAAPRAGMAKTPIAGVQPVADRTSHRLLSRIASRLSGIPGKTGVTPTGVPGKGKGKIPAPAGPQTVDPSGLQTGAKSGIMAQIKSLKSHAPDLIKGAAALAITAVAIIALAVAVLKIAQGIMKFAKIDGKEALKVGANIAGIIGAAGLIALATIGAAESLKYLNKLNILSRKIATEMLKGALTLLILTPAIIALALAVIKITQYLTTGITAQQALKTAQNIAGIMLAAGIIGSTVVASAAGLYGLGKLRKVAPDLTKTIYHGLADFAIVLPAVMALTTAIWGFVKFLSVLWTPESAQEAVVLVTSSFAAMTTATLGIAAGAALLYGLGSIGALSWKAIGFVYAGIAAVAVMMPAVMALYLAVTGFIKFLEKLWTVAAAQAAVKLVAASFAAMTMAAAGIAAAGAGLAKLGSLGWMTPKIVLWSWIGIAAVKLMMPAVKMLFNTLTGFIKFLQEFWTVAEAQAASKLIIASFTAMGLAALGIVTGGAALIGVSLLGQEVGPIILYAWVGIAAIKLIMPAIMMLFKTIKGFIDYLQELWTVAEAQKATELLKASFVALALAATGIVAAGASLMGLSLLTQEVGPLILFAWAGIAAIKLMMPAVMMLFNTIVDFIEWLSGLWTVDEANRATELIKASFEALGLTALGIVAAGALLAGFASLNVYAALIVALAWLGKTAIDMIMPAVQGLVESVIGFIKFLAGQWSADDAVEGAKLVKASFEAIGLVMAGVISASMALAALGLVGALGGAWHWFGALVAVGVEVFGELRNSFKLISDSVIAFIKDIGAEWGAAEWEDAAKLVKAAFSAIGIVMAGVISASTALAALGLVGALGGLWHWFEDLVAVGVEVFGELRNSFKLVSDSVIGFVKDIGAEWGAAEWDEAAILVKAAFTAIGLVMAGVISASTALAALGLVGALGGLWHWFEDLVAVGVEVFGGLRNSFKLVSDSVIGFVKDIGAEWGAAEWDEAAKLVTAAFSAIGVVMFGVISASMALAALGLVGALGGAWHWFEDLVAVGVEVFGGLRNSFKLVSDSVIAFIKDIGAEWGAADWEEAAKLSKAAFTAIGIVMFGVISASMALAALGLVGALGGAWHWFEDLVAVGVEVFGGLRNSFKLISDSVIGFIKDIGAEWGAADWEQAAKLSKAAFAAIGAVASGIVSASVSLAALGLLGGMFNWFAKLVGVGVIVFQWLRAEFAKIVESVKEFIGTLAAMWTASDAEKAAALAKASFATIATVVDGIISAATGMANLALLTRFSQYFGANVQAGAAAFDILSPAVTLFTQKVATFTKTLLKTIDLNSSKAVSVLLNNLGNIAVSLADMLKTTGDKLVPLTRVSMFTGQAPIDKIKASMESMQNYFPAIAQFIRNGIIIPLRDSFEKVANVQGAEKMLVALSSMISMLPGMIGTLSQAIVPITSKGFMGRGQTQGEKLVEASGLFETFMKSISEFVRTGIMKPINDNFEDVLELKEVETKLISLTSMIGRLPDMIKQISNAVNPIASKGFMGRGQTQGEKLVEASGLFETFMTSISAFVRTGIMKPINDNFEDAMELKEVETKLIALASMLSKLPGMMASLTAAIIPITTKGFLSTKTPADAILAASGEFETFMASISKMVATGIVAPINKHFADVFELEEVQQKIAAMTKMITTLPAMFTALVNGIVPVIEGSFFTRAPEKSLNGKFRTKFKKFFEAIASWLKTGIVNPIIENFGDAADLDAAAAAVKSMTAIVTSLPPMFDALVNGIVPLFEGTWFDAAPYEKLNGEFQQRFATFFWGISSFLKFGIVWPIMMSFGDAKMLDRVKQSVESMTAIVTSLPPMFEALVNSLVPLFEGNWFDDAPAEKLNGEFRQKFTDFFWAIAHFIDQGIIAPILQVLGNPKDMKVAAESLRATGDMIGALPGVINGTVDNILPLKWVAKRMGRVGLFEDANVYKKFFDDLFRFLDTGIITPVLDILGDPRDMKVAADSLKATAMMIEALPLVINGVLEKVLPLKYMARYMGRVGLFEDANVYKKFFDDLFRFLDTGIITPVLSILGDPRDMKIAAEALKATAMMIEALPLVINGVIKEIIPLKATSKDMNRTTGLFAQASVYKKFFDDLFRFLDTGIITPILSIIGDPRDMKVAAEALKATAIMMEALPNVIWGTISATQGLDAYSAILGSATGNMATSLDVYKQFFITLFNWLDQGIVTPILDILGDPRDMQMAAQSLAATASVVRMIPGFISDLATVTMQLQDGWWWKSPLRAMGDSIQVFSSWFQGIAYGIGLGIMYPIRTYFPQPQEIMAAQGQLTGMVAVVRLLPRFIEELATEMANIQALPWWSQRDQIRTDAVTFSDFFGAIAYGLGIGIMTPIRTLFPESGEFEEINARLDGVSAMLPKVRNVIDTLMVQLTGLGGEVGVYQNMLNTAVDAYYMAAFFQTMATNIRMGMIVPVQSFPDSAVLQELIARLDQVKIMIPKVKETIDAMMTEVGSFNNSYVSWWSRIAENWNISAFANFFAGLATTISSGIIAPVQNFFPESSIMQDLVKRLEALKLMMPLVTQAIDATMNEVNAFNARFSGWSSIQASFDAARFANFFQGIAVSIATGILMPVNTWLPDSRLLTELSARISGVAMTLPLVGQVIDSMVQQMNSLNTGPNWDMDLTESADRFGNFFRSLATAIRTGIIDPVQNTFPDTAELTSVMESLDALNGVLSSLDITVATLMGTMDRLGGANLDLSGLQNLNLKGLADIQPDLEALSTLNLPNEIPVAGELRGISAAMDPMRNKIGPPNTVGPNIPLMRRPTLETGGTGMVGGIGAPGAEVTGGVVLTRDTAVVDAINNMLSVLVSAFKTTTGFSTNTLVTTQKQQTDTQGMSINQAVTTSGQTAASAIENSTQTVQGALGGIGETVRTTVTDANNVLRQEVGDRLSRLQSGPINPNDAAEGAPTAVTQQLATGAQPAGLGGIFTHGENLATMIESLIAPKLTEVSTQVEPRQVASAQPMVDMQAAVEQRKASETANTGAGGAPLDSLSELTQSQGEQVTISRQMLDALLKIAAALEPSSVVAAGGGGNRANTTSLPTPTTPPRYYRLTAGLFNQSASTGVLPANV